MRIKLTPMFTEADIQKEIDLFLERLVKVIKNELDQLAMQIVRDARLKTKGQGGFDDQTGNLRSSMGFCLTYDGEILQEEFRKSDKGTDKSTGVEEGRKYAESLVGSKGWGIVIVAGMDYARYVEAKGYDVISGSTLNADKKLDRAMRNILNAFR